MRNSIVILLASLILIGCGPAKFQIRTSQDKFSDPNAPEVTSGTFNRLSSESSRGGVHIDEKGVYIDPFIAFDKVKKQLGFIGFFVNHINHDIESGFRPIKEIIIITDMGERVSLKIEDTDSDYKISGWNTVSKQFNTSFSEGGTAYTTVSDFKKLVRANSIEVKIQGGKLTKTYEKTSISETFLPNLRLFYEEVKKYE